MDIIKNRRSIRRFTDEPVPEEVVNKILEAGRWAPSGLNNQPWRFALVTDASLITEISELTRYSSIVKEAKVLIAVFLDNEVSYHRIKDAQAVGACLQNMLLEIHSLNLGGVWLGEIIKSDQELRKILGLGDALELMAVIALGHPGEKPKKVKRKTLQELIVFRK